MELLQSLLREWNSKTSERAKLQHTYLILIVTVVIVAGLVTLLNPSLGHTIILFAGFLLMVLVANAITWALLKSFVIDHVKTKRSSK